MCTTPRKKTNHSQDQTIEKKMQIVEEKEWKEEMERKPKLRTYKTIKHKLEAEQYLLTEENRQGRYLVTASNRVISIEDRNR